MGVFLMIFSILGSNHIKICDFESQLKMLKPLERVKF